MVKWLAEYLKLVEQLKLLDIQEYRLYYNFI